MDKPYQVMPDIEVLPSHFPVPGAGFLPVNAFVLKAKEPVLIDTGMGIDSEEFMKALESVIDPRDLKWVWITHDDADHIGTPTTGYRKDRTVSGAACDDSTIHPRCCSRPDGPGANISPDEMKERS